MSKLSAAGALFPKQRAAGTAAAVELRPYQQEAIERISAGLRDGGRGQLHAACGSGKTLMSVHAGAALVPADGLVVVLVPSLTLVAQTIGAWRTHTTVDRLLAVCCDETVTDTPVTVADLPAEVSTDTAHIRRWLAAGAGRRLVVGTYRSAGRLAEAVREHGTEADLLILDEAHHLAGRPDLSTRKVLQDDHLPARRRLFMTATPRIDDVRAENSGALSMDDQVIFGPVLYSYAWARAISDGYLDDYRIVVMGTSESELMDMLRDEEHEYVDRPGAPDLRILAAQAVTARAARQHRLRRVLAFCPSLDSSREFTRTLHNTLARLPHEAQPDMALYASWIEGRMGDRQRQRELDRLRQPPDDGWTVVSNVRCLSEGVDVPAVDAVAFVHPKRSQVDIIQAVGRALRRSSEGTGTATIIVPIVIPDSNEEIGDLDPGEYRVLWQVVRALRAHDETLGIELDTQRTHDTTSNPQLPGRITIEMPPGTSDALLARLKALTVRQTTSAWWDGYRHAQDFYRAHGNLDVHSGHVTDDGFRLGQWIVNTRQHYRKGWLRPDRITALEKIGMVWDTSRLPWQRFIRELREFKTKFGHVLVRQDYVTPSGYPLGSKVNTSRTRGVPDGIRQTLDDLGMVWNTRHLYWQQLHTACYQYREAHGHLRVRADHVTDDGFPLGNALKRKLKAWRDGDLDPAEQASLEELGMRFTDDSAWVDFLEACDRYRAKHGNLDVRMDYVDDTGYRLGSRINYYRTLYQGTRKPAPAGEGASPQPRTLSADRKAALDRRGMIWRVAPHRRPLTPAEHATLRSLTGEARGSEIIRLVDTEHVMQSTIADALGMHRSYLNTKIKTFRATGRWPTRSTPNTRPAPDPADSRS